LCMVDKPATHVTTGIHGPQSGSRESGAGGVDSLLAAATLDFSVDCTNVSHAPTSRMHQRLACTNVSHVPTSRRLNVVVRSPIALLPDFFGLLGGTGLFPSRHLLTDSTSLPRSQPSLVPLPVQDKTDKRIFLAAPAQCTPSVGSNLPLSRFSRI